MSKVLKAVVAACAVVSFGAQADLIIDDFSSNTGMASGAADITNNGSAFADGSGIVTGTGGTIIGGSRDVYVIKTEGSVGGPKGIIADVDTSTKTFSFSQDNDQGGKAWLRWDGASVAEAINKTGLGVAGVGKKLEENGSGFEFTVKSDAQLSVSYGVMLSVYDMDGDLSTFSFTAFGTNQLYVPVFVSFFDAAWTNRAAVDFNNVGALQVDFNTGATASIDVDVALRNPKVVPEPGSIALVGLALAGLGFASRRKV